MPQPTGDARRNGKHSHRRDDGDEGHRHDRRAERRHGARGHRENGRRPRHDEHARRADPEPEPQDAAPVAVDAEQQPV